MNPMKNQPHSKQDPLEKLYDVADSQLMKVEVRPTELPFDGMGLFATKDIEKGELIGEYYGSVTSYQASQSHVFDNEAKMLDMHQNCIIGRCPVSRINDIVDFKKFTQKEYEEIKQNCSFPTIKGHTTNATISYQNKGKGFMKSTRPIKAGEQIYVQYGFNYWRQYYDLLHGLDKLELG